LSSAHYLTTLSQPVAVVPPIPRGSPRGPRRAHGVALAPAAPCTTRRSGNRLARSAAPSGWSRQPDPLALGRRPLSALPGRGTAGRRRSRPHSRPAARIPTAAAARPTDASVPAGACLPNLSPPLVVSASTASSSRYASNPQSEVIAEPWNRSITRRSKFSLSAPLYGFTGWVRHRRPVRPNTTYCILYHNLDLFHRKMRYHPGNAGLNLYGRTRPFPRYKPRVTTNLSASRLGSGMTAKLVVSRHAHKTGGRVPTPDNDD